MFFRIVFIFIFLSVFGLKLFSCDQTSINVLTAKDNGNGTYGYDIEICLGISPNWGGTFSFVLDADVNILNSGFTPSIATTYNYCTASLSCSGANCLTESGNIMGCPPAGGDIINTTVIANGIINNGNLKYNPTDTLPLSPSDIGMAAGDCSDCNNPNQLCFYITITADSIMSSIQLTGAEQYDNNCTDTIAPFACCPDEIDNTMPLMTSISEKKSEQNISVHPNPNNGKFALISPPFGQLKIFNYLGESVYQSEIKNSLSEIDLKKSGSGVYSIQIMNEKGILTKKIVVE